ncbi:MAG: hypothetical protein ACOCWT_04795 [Desulfohalobiaceae bacterium]
MTGSPRQRCPHFARFQIEHDPKLVVQVDHPGQVAAQGADLVGKADQLDVLFLDGLLRFGKLPFHSGMVGEVFPQDEVADQQCRAQQHQEGAGQPVDTEGAALAGAVFEDHDMVFFEHHG